VGWVPIDRVFEAYSQEETEYAAGRVPVVSVWECDLCGREFSTEGGYVSHRRRAHRERG
jgi:hypothetical protein